MGKDELQDRAIENGDIQNIYRGFQPLKILFETLPTKGKRGLQIYRRFQRLNLTFLMKDKVIKFSILKIDANRNNNNS